jgi:tetratricopeptide (TPR) repeat protein
MPNSPSFEELCTTGRAHLKAGRLDEAQAAFDEARRLNDLDADVHDGLATVNFLRQAYEPAVMHFERVTRLDPRRGSAWINLGAVYNRMGNHNKAAEVLRRAVQIEKKSGVAYYNLGIAYKHLKQWAMAVPAYREAIRLEPRMADAYLNLANVFVKLNNFAQAVTNYRKALELDPKLERAQRGLERAEAELNATKKATTPFGRLVNTDKATADSVADSNPSRDLTDEERRADRHTLFDLINQVSGDVDELLEVLSEQLDPSVRTLNKMLTQPKSPHGASITKAEAFDNFTEARAQYLPRVEQLRSTLRRLREHEAQFQ